MIVINNFGQEDKSYIPIETLLKRGWWPGIVDTVRDIHWHPDHPENHNVRMVSQRRKTAAIRKNGAWHREPASEVVKKLMQHGFDTVIGSFSSEANVMTDERANAMLLGADLKSKKPDVVQARQRVLTMVLETPKLPDT